jgi:hypothetical protein
MNLKLHHSVILYGLENPLPDQIELRAGLLSAVLEDGMLRNIRFEGQELVRGVYVAVRDKNWGTIPCDIQFINIIQNEDSFCVTFTCDHQQKDIHFVWKATITGNSDGSINYTMDGTAKSSFLKNRIGFCVLHPMELAGTPIQVKTPSGVTSGEFPVNIAPYQPFLDITSISHPVGKDINVEIDFKGDLFEMEDQRNWTDASYKTYCTPLGRPFPEEVQEGQSIVQSVIVRVQGKQKLQRVYSSRKDLKVKVELAPGKKLPPLGLAFASDEVYSEGAIEYLQQLNLNHLRCKVDLANNRWRDLLLSSCNVCGQLGTSLHLEVNWCGAKEFEELTKLIKSSPLPVSHLFIFSPMSFVSKESELLLAREILQKHDLAIAVGGGSNAFFTQLNRSELPLGHMDFAGYTLNPQVHAFDNTSLIETLAAQSETVYSTRKIIGDLPLIVGPVTFKMRFNPDATEQSLTQYDPKSQFDPRQQSLFGAGWTIGSLHSLTVADVTALTYYETVGWNGLIRNEDLVYPLYHVFADIGEMGDADTLKVEINDPYSVESIALVRDSHARVLLANLTDKEQVIMLDLPNFKEAKIRIMDEINAADAIFDPSKFRKSTEFIPLLGSSESMQLHLLPFASVCLDLNLV